MRQVFSLSSALLFPDAPLCFLVCTESPPSSFDSQLCDLRPYPCGSFAPWKLSICFLLTCPRSKGQRKRPYASPVSNSTSHHTGACPRTRWDFSSAQCELWAAPNSLHSQGVSELNCTNRAGEDSCGIVDTQWASPFMLPGKYAGLGLFQSPH